MEQDYLINRFDTIREKWQNDLTPANLDKCAVIFINAVIKLYIRILGAGHRLSCPNPISIVPAFSAI